MTEQATGQCCACHEEKPVFVLRHGVVKCGSCICQQIGRSTMDLFRKGIRPIPAPVHILVAVSDDPSSNFLFHLLHSRLNTSLTSKSAVCRKLEAISGVSRPNGNYIEKFTLPAITQWAKEHDFNCVVLGDDASHIALASLAAISCGRTDLLHSISTDDTENYGITVLRPVRQCLRAETRFYCQTESLNFSEAPSLLERAFSHEAGLLEAVLADGHGGTPFAVQKLAERVTAPTATSKCPECGLPSKSGDPCGICVALARVQ
jgi:hypothetical protein